MLVYAKYWKYFATKVNIYAQKLHKYVIMTTIIGNAYFIAEVRLAMK